MAMDAGRVGEQAWLVGASFGPSDDQTPRFLTEGIWENGYKDRYLDLVKSIRAGDRIAIKSTYTRKNDLPFDARGFRVSVMAIKAIGTVKRNHGDGRRLDVQWTPVERDEWYFYTYRSTVWRVLPGSWEADALLAFTFEGKPQDVERFRNAPFWRERWGSRDPGVDQRFAWTPFYEAMADAVASYRVRRPELAAILESLSKKVDGLTYLTDHYADGTTSFLRDICPFTFFGVFNRGITAGRRTQLAQALADALGVKEPVPDIFDGIPVLENRKSWFFSWAKERGDGDIEALWEVFDAARQFADGGDAESRSRLFAAYDDAAGRPQVGWNLSFGLYWVRPWSFLTLDTKSREFLQSKLETVVPLRGPKGRCSGEDYVGLLELLSSRFAEQTFPVHSFPETALEAWLYRSPEPAAPPEAEPQALVSKVSEPEVEEPAPDQRPPIVPYSLENVIAEGCFLGRDALEGMLRRLRDKKNLVLQGPPGTGKTWLARRLGFALIGERDESRLRAVQFHPTLSYEDFVRGLRPNTDGKLEVVDGVFLRAVEVAKATPTVPFVVVIEEINRGNPAQILGEMLTLLEADKRTPDQALELMHAKDGKRVHIPPNLHVIGTMNIADRSLALVDLALRRRFAFVELEPQLGDAWRRWVTQRCRVPETLADEVQRRIQALNERIASDASLGKQFRVGHSFVTPPTDPPAAVTAEWFRGVVETEIGPLLEEYWYDQPGRASESKVALLKEL